jgi:uncharacterized protein YegP (UPF0339 family)
MSSLKCQFRFEIIFSNEEVVMVGEGWKAEKDLYSFQSSLRPPSM